MTSRSDVKGGGGQRFCDGSTEALVIKPVTIGEGCQKLSKIACHLLWMTPFLKKKILVKGNTSLEQTIIVFRLTFLKADT